MTFPSSPVPQAASAALLGAGTVVDPAELAAAFPAVDCGHQPFAEFVIVQIRRARARTSGGIELIEDSRQTETDNTQVAKVVAIGPLAFTHRSTGEPWPGGAWYSLGDFVRCPKYGGDRWKISISITEPERKVGSMLIPPKTFTDTVEFALFKDLDIRTKVVGNPLAVKAYL